MIYDLLYKNAQMLNELVDLYNDLKNKKQTGKIRKQLEQLKIYIISTLKNIEDQTG